MKKLFVLALLLLSFIAKAQDGHTIKLKNDKSDYKPLDFVINSTVDERADSTTIGYIRLPSNRKKDPINLENGAAWSIGSYISSMGQNGKGTPVSLHITEFDVSERRIKGKDAAIILIQYVFYIEGEKQLMLTSEAQVPAGEINVEKSIRKQTERLVSQFGRWFAENRKNILAKPSINVTAMADITPRNRDIITYTRRRKLNYNDFESRPDRKSEYAAATSSGISMAIASTTRYKHIEAKVKIGAYFHKNLSWFKKDAKNSYVLDHEQLHFDITALITCEFIKAMRTYNFTPETYVEKLKQLHSYYEELKNQMQIEYDEETDHGLIKEKQAEWRKKINGLMKEQDCYK